MTGGRRRVPARRAACRLAVSLAGTVACLLPALPAGATDTVVILRGRSATSTLTSCQTASATPVCDAATVDVGWSRSSVDGAVTTMTFVNVTLYTVTLLGDGTFEATPVAEGMADRGAIRIARDQSRASATGRVQVRACTAPGEPCDGAVREIAYDVQWDAAGSPSVYAQRSRTSFAGCVTVDRVKSSERTARARGTVDGKALEQAPVFTSTIAFSKSVSFTTGCG
jgi:hypothetical protein